MFVSIRTSSIDRSDLRRATLSSTRVQTMLHDAKQRGAHERQRLSTRRGVALTPSNRCPPVDAVEGFPNELRFRYAELTSPALQHSIMALFDVHLFTNHDSRSHTS